MRTGGGCRTVDREISRFPRKERLHMPGSSTTPDRPGARDIASVRVAFRARNSVGTRGLAFAAQWLAYALPYRRFVAVLADANARLGADVDRYSFIVVDLPHLLLAGLPAHFESDMPSHAVRSPPSPGAVAPPTRRDAFFEALPPRCSVCPYCARGGLWALCSCVEPRCYLFPTSRLRCSTPSRPSQ